MDAKREKRTRNVLTILFCLFLAAAGIGAHYRYDPWGYYWKVPEEEASIRRMVIQTAEKHLGSKESDNSHRQIIDCYNSHEPLAMGYTMDYTDSWCAAFVSAVAIECNLTDIIPTECGCERQIGLFLEMGCWTEQDSAIPLPGDLIYYDWDMEERGECSGWSDHVGIVVGTKWPFLKVIEGNWNDSVTYRYLLLNHLQIRGFAKPDYAGYVKEKTP